MISNLSELFSYTFISRALLVGILVSLCASLLGVSLVLKRYSMIGDGLSHVGFGALSIAMALNMSPLQVSLPVVVVSAFFLLRISENSKIRGDAAIALISSSALAIGVIATSLTTGMNVDVHNFMFGSILAIEKSDVYLSVIVSIGVLILYSLFYNKIFAITFDENFAKATGIRAERYNMLIALLTALVQYSYNQITVFTVIIINSFYFICFSFLIIKYISLASYLSHKASLFWPEP